LGSDYNRGSTEDSDPDIPETVRFSLDNTDMGYENYTHGKNSNIMKFSNP